MTLPLKKATSCVIYACFKTATTTGSKKIQSRANVNQRDAPWPEFDSIGSAPQKCHPLLVAFETKYTQFIIQIQS